MKKAFQKILSLLMALLLLLSTVSWTVEKHTCMGRVMDTALFAEAEDCGMDAAMKVLEDASLQNHCCADETFTLQGQDDLKISFNDISFDEQLFLVAFTISYIDLFTALEEQKLTNEYYPPPLLVKDILLLNETFLI